MSNLLSLKKDEDVTLKEQNRSLLSKIKELKNAAAQQRQYLLMLTDKQDKFNKALSTLNTHWNLLDFDLKTVLATLDSDSPPPPIPSFNKINSAGKDGPPNNILEIFHQNGQLSGTVDTVLHNRCDSTCRILEQVLQLIEQRRTSCLNVREELLRLSQEGSSTRLEVVLELISVENKRMRSEIEGNAKLIEFFSQEKQRATKRLSILRDTDHEAMQKELRKHLDDLIYEIDMKNKKLDGLAMELQSDKFGDPRSNIQSSLNEPQVVVELREVLERNKRRQEEINQLREERNQVINHFTKLHSEILCPADEKVLKSRPFMVIHQRWHSAVVETEICRAQIERLTADLNSRTSVSKVEYERIKMSDNSRIKVLEKHIEELNRAVNSIRVERDHLSAVYLQKEERIAGIPLVGELKGLLSSQQLQLKKLKADNSQLQTLCNSKNDTHIHDTDLPTATGDGDENDPQYVESLLRIHKQLKAKLSQAQQAAQGLKRELETKKMETEYLSEEIEFLAKAYDEIQDQTTRLKESIAENDESNTQLMTERIQAKKMEAALKEEKRILAEKLSKLEETCHTQGEFVRAEESRVKILQEQVKKANEEIRLALHNVENQKRANREAATAQHEMKSKIEELQQACVELKKKQEEATARQETETARAGRVEEEHNTLKRKLEKLSAKTTNHALEEEIKACKQAVQCTVCRERTKNTVIAKCFHVFCRQCIQRCLDSKQKKCPTCSKSFGENDIHSIFW
eukprot:TRINITY_DN6298_c0_g1_i1.p1 TRINITY_DN6298_c0_g1~~TRINITY_DN6298_c0_g1_i1.p1  ORF type:complete len:745 (+),score=142.83 TRINITY_DN6298_c0_g1_i1:117-2351(+)